MATIRKDSDHELNPTTLRVDENGVDLRLDVFLAQNLAGMSRSQVKKIIETKTVTINGKVCRGSERMVLGDEVALAVPEKVEPKLQPVAMDLDILFEDEHLIVLNKPVGLMVHPGAGSHGPTLVEGLLYHAKTLSQGSSPFRPGIVHRLDKDTSGAIVCAKDDATHAGLSAQFKSKSNYREYVGILDGYLTEEKITRESYLQRDPRSRTQFVSMELEDYEIRYDVTRPAKASIRFAKSHFKRLKTYRKRLTLAAIQLETGRTHQIRVHARDLKAPILADLVYGISPQLGMNFPKEIRDHVAALKRQMLHAKILGFEHPSTGKKIAFEAPMPKDMRDLCQMLDTIAD